MIKKKNFLFLFCSLFSLGIIIFFNNCSTERGELGCNSDLTCQQECVDTAETKTTLIQCIPNPILPEEVEPHVTETVTQNASLDDGTESSKIVAKGASTDYECTTERTEGNSNEDNVVNLARTANADVMYPGALVQGDGIQTGHLSPFPGKRAGGIIVIQGLTFGPEDAVSAELDSVGLASVTEAIQQNFLQQQIEGTAADISYDIFEGHDKLAIKAKLGLGINQEEGNAGDGLDEGADTGCGQEFRKASLNTKVEIALEGCLDMRNEESTVVLKFSQGYYTVSFQQPDSLEEIWYPGVDVSKLRNEMGPGNPPAYISTVTYGRLVYFFLKSKESFFQVKGALEVAAGNVDVEISGEYSKTLEESKMNMVVLGGNAQDAIEAAVSLNPLEDLKKYLKEGGNYSNSSPGAPIAYQARWLNGFKPAKLSVVTDFTKTECVPLDPSEKLGAWNTTSPLKTARYGHSSESISGKLYVFGGYGTSPLNSIESVGVAPADGSLGTWTILDTTLPSVLYDHATVIAGDYLFLIGGNNGADVNTVYSIPTSDIGKTGGGTFTNTGKNLPGILSGHRAVAYNGYIYVIGGLLNGQTSNQVLYAKVDGSGSIEGTWETAESLFQVRRNFAASVFSGNILVFGGYDTDDGLSQTNTVESALIKDDASLSSWNKESNGLGADLAEVDGAVMGGFAFSIGGSTGSPVTTIYFSQLTAGDGGISFSSDGWIANKNSLATAISGASAQVFSGAIYSIGGNQGSAATTEVSYSALLDK
jgi:hypothetical protein